MKCRNCDKIEPRGCGKTCCAVDKKVINDFDSKCHIDKENKINEQNTGNNGDIPVETRKSA